jgi:hypothetical protein
LATERIRIEIGFDGGQIMSALVDEAMWQELERQVLSGGPGGFALEADEGRYVIALARVVYAKRFARESRVGFGTVGGATAG